MQRVRFLSVILLFLLASLFILRFSFYPLLRGYLEIQYDIRVEMGKSGICGIACLSIPTLSIEQPGVFRFDAENLTVSAWARREGPFDIAAVVPRLAVGKGQLTIVDLDALMGDSDEPLFGPELPYFPLEQVAIDHLSITLSLPERELKLSDMSLKGDGLYTFTIPEAVYTQKGLRAAVLSTATLSFRAKGRDYAVLSLKGSGTGFELSGAATPAGFTGRAVVRLDQIVERLDDRPASGEIVADITGTLFGGAPQIAADIRGTGFGWNDEFRIWDVAAHLTADPRGLIIDQLVLFNGDKPFLSLGGVMNWREAMLRGSITLWDLDFKDTLNRFDVSCWVDMWISGNIDYDFSFDTLVAQYRPQLTARDFAVHDDGTLSILDLADTYQVVGRGEIRPDRITLDEAEVTVRDDTTHLFLHDSWFDLDDYKKFRIIVRPHSWVDLARIDRIVELPAEGRGAIDVAITSFYRNPRIVGHFKGKECAVQGFEAGDCDLTVELKDFVLSFLGNRIDYRSVHTEGSRVALDFNKTPTDISFLFNNMSGDLKDVGAVLRRKLPDMDGRFAFTAEGRYAGRLTSLTGKAQADKVRFNDLPVADRVTFSFVDEKDLLRIAKGAIMIGDSSLALSGTMDRRTFTLDAQATLDAFFRKDFAFLDDTSFIAPRALITVTGPLTAPKFAAEAFLGRVQYQEVVMGNFSVAAAYDLGTGQFTAAGNLGEAASFRGEMQGLDPSTLTANIKVQEFVHKKGDLFFKTSFDAKWTDGELDARIGKLMIEKRGLFARNAQPFHLKGRWEKLTIEQVAFDGETLNGVVRGELRAGKPYIEAVGTLFPAVLDSFVGAKLFTDVAGNAAFNLRLEDDALSGSLMVRNLGFTLAPYDLPVAKLDGSLSFTGGAWKIESLSGLIGGGKLEVKGSGALTPTTTGQIGLSITNAAARQRYIGPFAFSSYLDIVLTAGESPSISGDIEIKNITYRDDLSLDNELVKLLGKARDPDKGAAGAEDGPFSDPRFNLHLTGRNALRIMNNILKADLAFDMRLTGSYRRPALSGSLQLNAGELTFKQNRFTLDRGLVTVETEERIRPYLDIQGTTRVYARSKETEYKLVLGVSGYPEDLAIRLSSMPQLEETQAYSLLLWGDFFDPTQPGVENLALVAVTDIMGISDEVKKNFQLARFELTPKYSEIDYKTVLKIIAVKEIYPFLVMSIESNPADPADQMIGLSYRGSNFDLSLDWKYKNKLETTYGGVGVNFILNYLFE
ncbi:MAG TPA: translocation/assembly module TamB domain-containing protein [bacterium]|nr:translocation/assembly module TamB domain-containing protein [bacterium]